MIYLSHHEGMFPRCKNQSRDPSLNFACSEIVCYLEVMVAQPTTCSDEVMISVCVVYGAIEHLTG